MLCTVRVRCVHVISYLNKYRARRVDFTRKISSKQENSVQLYNPIFYNYLQRAKRRVSMERSSWPPSLLEFFGEKPSTALNNLTGVVDRINEVDDVMKSYSDLEELIEDSAGESDPQNRDDLITIAESEKSEILSEISNLNELILRHLLDLLPRNHLAPEIMLEISQGVGGREAMLFTAEMFEMYEKFCRSHGQDFEILSLDRIDTSGGYKEASAHITFNDLKFCQMLLNETGVHRVQRVPATEKSSRIHTSTISVSVLPLFKDEEIVIPEKDLEITTLVKMNSPGGQHANKTESAVRIKHKPSGKIIQCSATRSQATNREYALNLLKAKLSQEKTEKQQSILSKTRREQVKNRERSDKIRTYNFHQDRITDHRIGFTSTNISNFMSGSTQLYNLMETLSESMDLEELNASVQALLKEGKTFFPHMKLP